MKPLINFLENEIRRIKDKLSKSLLLEKEDILTLFLATLVEEDVKK